MEPRSLIALAFLIFGTIFVLSLIKGIFQIINKGYKKSNLNAQNMIQIFLIPLLSLVALLVLVFYIIPNYG